MIGDASAPGILSQIPFLPFCLDPPAGAGTDDSDGTPRQEML